MTLKAFGAVLIFISIATLNSQSPFNYQYSYSTEETVEFLYASAAAYCSNYQWLVNFTCGTVCSNLTGYQYFNSYQTTLSDGEPLQFIMIVNPNTQRFVTAFQGTSSPVQLVHELIASFSMNYTLGNIPGAQVLDYFGKFYEEVLRPNFIQYLQDAVQQYPDYMFIFTGHSLGAALTTLAGADAIMQGIVSASNTVMYTYGSPRVGNWAYSSYVDSLFGGIYRVVHYQDLVPHVPPCAIFGECSLSMTAEKKRTEKSGRYFLATMA